jgi:hypothetical protein
MVIEYPELLPDALQQTRADFEQEARMAGAERTPLIIHSSPIHQLIISLPKDQRSTW